MSRAPRTERIRVLHRLGWTVSQQLAKPQGLLGRLFGRALAKQNLSLNTWMVELLDVQPHDRVVEVGCGPGTAIQQLAARAPSGLVAGVDYSPVMVAQARDRNRLAVRAGTVEVKEGDAAHLPYPDGRFDAACAVNVLYFWADPLVALEELRRVLRPAGRVALAYQVEAHTPPQLRTAFSQGGYHLVTAEQVEQLLALAGFIQVRTEVKQGPRAPEGFCTLARNPA
jgi:ubiquinone/menaquinone biosynthesis C-methylase UbiE